MTRILLSGSCGFVGSHILDRILEKTDWEVVVLDKINYAGFLKRISTLDHFNPDRVKFVWHDLRAPINEYVINEIGTDIDYIAHLAANSSVEATIKDPVGSVYDNVLGTVNLLEFARTLENLKLFNMFSCYDSKTRVFTKNGLKKYSELNVGDIVFTINPDTKKVEEQPVEKIIIQDYEGEMVHFDNRTNDLLVTPNHRMYDNNLLVREASDCGEGIKLPLGFKYSGASTQINEYNLGSLFYVIGVYLGNGFTAYQKKVRKNKSGLDKKDFIARRNNKGQFIRGRTGTIESTITDSWRVFFDVPENDKARAKLGKSLTDLGIEYTSQKGKSGEHLYFTSEEWVKFFDQFGKEAKNKFIPDKFKQYDSKYLKQLFDGLIDSDGNWQYVSFSTVSDKLANDICEIGMKIGLIPTKRLRTTDCIYEGRSIQGVSHWINFSDKNQSVGKKMIHREDYKGKIWCIRVKNKNFLVERNGKYAFSGNTDETLGPAPEGVNFTEDAPHNPSNPYSAGKSGAEDYSLAYHTTYKVPVFITRTMNVFATRQHPEKLVPTVIRKVLKGEVVPMYSNAEKTKAGSRFWIHATNVADALLFLFEKAKAGEKYHIVGTECNNLDLAQKIAKIIGKPLKYEMTGDYALRPGHDFRYGMSGEKLAKIGWKLTLDLDESLKETVEWYLKNQEWLLMEGK